MSLVYVGTTFGKNEPYALSEHALIDNIKQQIINKFTNDKCLLINLTWFGPQFDNDNWNKVLTLGEFDRVFFLASVDPCMIGDHEISTIKKATNSLYIYLLGNFDSPHQFNFFAPVVVEKFVKYSANDLKLDVEKIFICYNRKPKVHRVELVQQLKHESLDQFGTITLGRDETNIQNNNIDHEYLSIGMKEEDFITLGNHPDNWEFGIPLDNFSLHSMDVWKTSFLYIVGSTEFNPYDDLFCQQDTFKAILGQRPFIINGVQRTYKWLRYHGFKTFNHYWEHIDVENDNVHNGIIEVIKYLSSMTKTELTNMYYDMLPDLEYNKNHFYEFAKSQELLIDNIFEQ